MSKIWSVDGSLYMSEKSALVAAYLCESIPGYTPKVEIYTVNQVYETTNQFISEIQRDKQLRALLGELTEKEIKEINYKSNVESLITVMEKINFPEYYIRILKEDKDKESSVLKFIKENKVSFLSNSKDIEYYKALIKLTGFSRFSKKKSEIVYLNTWGTNAKSVNVLNKSGIPVKPAYKGANYGYRMVEEINLDESYHNAFKQAKKELLIK